jgi:nucleotide-binding universal stress UspA family protein
MTTQAGSVGRATDEALRRSRRVPGRSAGGPPRDPIVDLATTDPMTPTADRGAPMNQQSLPPVVAGVDGSPAAEDAARVAAGEATRRGVPLRLVHAFHWPHRVLPGLPDGLDARAAARRSVTARLERLRASLAELVPAGEVSAAVLDGSADLVLHRESEAASLLVVGAAGLTWGRGPELGSVAESVAATAACPVLVHRMVPSPQPDRSAVVVGVDGGPGTAAVLAAAAQQAQLRRRTLRVVHAWRQLTEDAAYALRWRLDIKATGSAERSAVADHVADLVRDHPGLPVESVVVPGRAGHVLVDEGSSAELVVVGVRPLGTAGEGATTHSVLHRCSAPVLVVPVPSREEDAEHARAAKAVGPPAG